MAVAADRPISAARLSRPPDGFRILTTHVSRPIAEHAGSFGVLAGPARQLNLFIAAVVLAVMVLPTLASISRDVIKAVPYGMREAGVALGATWWETMWKVVLPAARAGVF